ncbi:MAG: RNA methyltransferase [Ignavibacteria bacterium]|nr:RNA methyltransferase [Ignavibacteria bacterium]MCU7504084.1 RNA methyltransferase [Ignavibacteria bacterium]MCU7518247.1 RNA methyltransferase [Ignavibacteria bacterium]
MRELKTGARLQKIIEAVKKRQHSLRVILENIHDPHNVSAILRTCDAVGVYKVSLVYNVEKFPKINRTSSASALKWVERESLSSIQECYSSLRRQGFKIYASALTGHSISLYDIDFTEKTAIVIGNEHRGVSKEAAELADGVFQIPMQGMVQSLNVSVANAVILYEAQRQRLLKGMYDRPELNEEEIERIIDEWCNK